VAEGNSPSAGKLADIAMMVLTGGKERSVPEYRELLGRAGFRLNKVVPVPGDIHIIEALPA
jgi:O-methyltransferase domain